MKILNKLTIKHLTLNKKRTIVSIVGILLSTALMVGIGLLCSTVRDILITDIIDNNGNYHASIANVNSKSLEIIEKDKDIANYHYEYGVGFSRYPESNNTSKVYYYVNAVNEEYYKELDLIEGDFPKNSDEILVSNHIFDYSDISYKVGDTITLSLGKRYIDETELPSNKGLQYGEILTNDITKTYKVVGIIERTCNTYESYSSPAFSLFTKADSNYDGNVKVYINYKKIKNVEEKTNKLAKKLNIDNDYIGYNGSLLAIYGESNYDNINSFLGVFMVIFLSIVSVACIIVIYNSFAISVMERKKQFGLFASIGTTRKQLRHTVFYEALIVGTIGIILGIVSAYIGIGTVLLIINNLLKEMIPYSLKLITYPSFIIIPIIFMIVVIIVSAFLPAKRASSVSPIEAIRQNDDIKINKKKIKTLGFVKKIFGIEGEIALKNIKRNKKKYRITVISLFISIVTFIAFSTYLDLGTQTTEDYMGSYDFDIMIYTSDVENVKDKEIIEKIVNNGNTDQSVKVRYFLGYTKRNNNNIYTDKYIKMNDLNKLEGTDKLISTVNVISLDDKSYQKYKKSIGLKDDKPIMINLFKEMDYSNKNRKLVETKVYKNNNFEYTLCDLNEVINPKNDDVMEWDNINQEYLGSVCNDKIDNFYLTEEYPELLELYKSYQNGTIVLNDKMFNTYMEKYSTEKEEQQIFIKSDKYDELDKLGKDLSDTTNYMNLTESSKMKNNVILVVKILLYGFISLVTLIGVTSVFNTINTSIMLRKKEFAVLRSIGLTPKCFNKMIWFESIFFGLKSLFYGIPFGLILSFLISKNMDVLVSNSTLYIPYKAILISIFGVFIVTILTMLYSTKKIKNENILDAIREENI